MVNEMKKDENKKYLNKLSRIAYWFLRREDAADVMEDYNDILVEQESDGELPYTFEDPYQIIKPLLDTKQYWLWMSKFCLMAVSMILICVALCARRYRVEWLACLYLFGQGISVFCFHRTNQDRFHGSSMKKPGYIILAETVLNIAFFVMMGWLYTEFKTKGHTALDTLDPSCIGKNIFYVMCILAIVVTITGVYGLYKARVCDQQWSAVYNLGMTIVMLYALILDQLNATNLREEKSVWILFIVILVTGWITTGVSLNEKVS